MLLDATLSALVNGVLLAGLPFLLYATHGKLRHGRGFAEATRRAGLRLGDPRWLGWSGAAAAAVGLLVGLIPPDLEVMTRKGSAWAAFAGLGWTATSVSMALLYGVVKTGFAEELLFRGLIAGSLGRRLSPVRANLLQAMIFLAPHLLLLAVMPEMAWFLALIFVGALGVGWVRLRSGSILGPWMIHAAANLAMGLSVAVRTGP